MENFWKEQYVKNIKFMVMILKNLIYIHVLIVASVASNPIFDPFLQFLDEFSKTSFGIFRFVLDSWLVKLRL